MSYNTVEINLAALKDNFLAIQNRVGTGVDVLAMVKSDGYGHGLVPVVKALCQAGGRCFGVAEIGEGITLRDAGVAAEIVVLLGSDHCQEIINYNLSPVVFDLDNLACLSKAAEKKGQKVGVHLKVDVGMGRLGIMPNQVVDFLKVCDDLPGVYLAGIMSHFPMADDAASSEKTSAQCRSFLDLAGEEQNRHIANSAAIISYPDSYLNMVRPGISLYGYYPADSQEARQQLDLTPVMSFKTRVIQLKDVPSGAGISYGHLFVTKRSTRLAVLPVGYADGYLRGLTGHAHVLIRGKRAPVCGRICMNACLVDVTDIPEVQVNDQVVLMGSQTSNDLNRALQTISGDEIAGWLDTISYEVLCLFGNNNDRVYV